MTRKVYMCLSVVFQMEDDEIRRELFAFVCFLRLRLDHPPIPRAPGWATKEQAAQEVLEEQTKSINKWLTEDCLAWAKTLRKLQLNFERKSIPLQEQTNIIEQCNKRDCLVWTMKPVSKQGQSYAYWNMAAAWRELWDVYSTKSCSSRSDCTHSRNFGLLEAVLAQTHAEIRRKCMLAVGNRLPVEIVDVVRDFTLLAEGVPVRSTTWTEVEVQIPPREPYTGTSAFERWEHECLFDWPEPSGTRIEKRLHALYTCSSMDQVPYHYLWS